MANQYADGNGDAKKFTAPQAPSPTEGGVLEDDHLGWQGSVPGSPQVQKIVVPIDIS